MNGKTAFRKTLFWDIDLRNFDPEKNPQFVIGRVLDFGNLREWRAVKKLYGKKKIEKAARKHVFSDDRSSNFWGLILNIPAKDLRCTRNPLLKIPNAFLKR